MNNTSAENTKFNKQPTGSKTLGFLKALAFYAISFTFWILLFVMNDGPGGVESQHLVVIGIAHTILIFIHGISAFDPKGSTNKELHH
jgi:hypothetical protein